MQTDNKKDFSHWEPQLGLLICSVQWCAAHRITLLVVGLFPHAQMGSGMHLSSTDLLETEVFFFPSHPALGLGLSGTVCLILSSENETKQKKPHQYQNLLTQLPNKPFYL